MKYQYLDLQTYKRKEHFAYFCGMAFPYVGITVNVDITDLLGKLQVENQPFFLQFAIAYLMRQIAFLSFDKGLWMVES